ncbi:MAG: GGDEF domain-containing protein [Halieaceae bacterium]
MEAQKPFVRADVVKNTALMMGWIALIATGLRVLIAQELHPFGITMGTVCALLLFAVHRQVRQGAPADTAAVAVLAIVIIVYATLSWSSHGFRGSVIFAAPMVPLLASMMLGKRAARLTTVLMAAFLLFILSQHLMGNLRPDENFPEEIRYSMRAIIMLLCLVGMNWIASYYAIIEHAGELPVATDNYSHDPLTGLLKPSLIEEAVEREFARARREQSVFSFALVEIDDYAGLVSEHGAQGADNCLLGVADALRYCMRRSSDDLGCYNDHQLCILLSGTGTSAAAVGEKFRAMIETLDIPLDPERTIRLTVSIGVCTAPARGLASAAAIIEGAQQALRRAQAEGGNRSQLEELSAANEPDAVA